jgi:methyltransferase (TIGR00027 family)
MRRNQSSLTAAGIAMVRAMESERPPDQRICYDPYAHRFAAGVMFQMVRLFEKFGYGERIGPGVMGFLVARERHIDQVLHAFLNEGLDQLVILGAGFDARAYRFPELQQGVKIFEVDHPATQQAKLAKLQDIFGQVPQHVVYVPVDFKEQTLAQRLPEAGYDETLKTLFIWQGVTVYLTPAAVDDTLAFVAHHSGQGSGIVFDYMYPSIMDGSQRHGEVKRMRRVRLISGEGLTFGIPEGTIEDFLAQRGFWQIHNADQHYLHEAYFTGPNRRRQVAGGYAVVSARVRPPELPEAG